MQWEEIEKLENIGGVTINCLKPVFEDRRMKTETNFAYCRKLEVEKEQAELARRRRRPLVIHSLTVQ